MFQTTSPLAFLISLLAGTPSRPRLASSKSALSASGRTWRCRFCASMVKVEGGLPFGLKCSGGAAAVCACAESAVRHRDDVNATSAMLESAKRLLTDVFVARKLIAVHPVMVRSSFDSGSRFAVGPAVVRSCNGSRHRSSRAEPEGGRFVPESLDSGCEVNRTLVQRIPPVESLWKALGESIALTWCLRDADRQAVGIGPGVRLRDEAVAAQKRRPTRLTSREGPIASLGLVESYACRPLWLSCVSASEELMSIEADRPARDAAVASGPPKGVAQAGCSGIDYSCVRQPSKRPTTRCESGAVCEVASSLWCSSARDAPLQTESAGFPTPSPTTVGVRRRLNLGPRLGRASTRCSSASSDGWRLNATARCVGRRTNILLRTA